MSGCRFLVLVALSACHSEKEDSGSAPPLLPFVGSDIDERDDRGTDPQSSFVVPDAYYEALGTLGLDPADLTWTDAGSYWDDTPTPLHWTGTLRHAGDQVPIFAHMVGEDAAKVLETQGDALLREMLATQYAYDDLESFVVSRFDQRFELAASETPLVDALRAFYEHAPVTGNPDAPSVPWSDIEADVGQMAAGFSHDGQEALALAIAGLVRGAEMRDEAILSGSMDIEGWRSLHEDFWDGQTGFSSFTNDHGTAAESVDFEKLARAGELVARSVESLRLALKGSVEEGAYLKLVGPLGRIVVDLNEQPSDYSNDDYFLLVDGGGDDVYYDHVATNSTIYLPVSVALDLGGNDIWTHDSDWVIDEASITISDARNQGFGLFGVAIVDDAGGDDTYHASGLSQGTGIFGVGVLVDHAGNDTYKGYYSAQGHGEWGLGLLLDLGAGSDAYETLQQSQGYGGPRGIGWLVDDGGDDTYLAIKDPIVWDWAGEGSNWSGSQGFGYGVRDGYFTDGDPIFSGGLGALIDLEGDDRYQCAVMCQGFGYAFGTGIFYDAGGNDEYLTTHKYSMGSATHWAAAGFVDLDGDDTYRNDDDDECIAEGYDGSVAWHLDRGDGSDTYTLDNYGDFVLGVGRIPAMGVFLNEGGDDTYSVPGTGDWALGRSYTADGDRDYSSDLNIGMFFDLGGDDTYATARSDVINGSEWIQTKPQGGDWVSGKDFGYGLDQ